MFLKRSWLIFSFALFIFTKGFSQDCNVNYFFKSYNGDGFNTGGSQGDKLTILSDSSMVMCNAHFVARMSKTGDVVWSKIFSGYGGSTTNAIEDYDGGIVCSFANNIIKLDTSGNVVYQKKIFFDTINGYDVTYSQSFRDIAILDNGDKMVLYQDVSGTYGGYLFRYDKDMNVIKWCKNIRYNYGITFTNMVIDGSKIILAGLCQENYYAAPFGFLAAIDSVDGSISRTGAFNCLNLGSLDRLYKGNGQYFLKGTLLNQTNADGRYCYMRIDAALNLLAIRRFVGYTDNFGTAFSFAPQNDNSLYGIIGMGFGATMFKIDNTDSVQWYKGYFVAGYPHDVQQNTEALFFAADFDYNAVGVGPKSNFAIYKTDFNCNISNNCITAITVTLATNNYNFFSVPTVTLLSTNKICTDSAGHAPVSTYALDPFGCTFNSVCNSVKLAGDTAICNNRPVYFTARRNAGCSNPVSWSVTPAVNYVMVNDSTISVNFINNGNYKITSKINDRCNEYKDSINVHVNLSGLLDMPGDTILCAGNTIKLSAGNQFKTYRWQDGSSDSFFVVNQTGKYFVTVKDFCNNVYSDTIHVTAANFYFNIGNDTVKCNNDSLMLSATSGFYNYQWTTPYNLNVVNDSTVIVNPDIDTFYIATAEKKPGCSVKDSIHIAVLNSPAIFLGNDTTLCTGQSLLLDAGNNFSFYSWSTGAVSKTITVNTAGNYFIKATAANGCSSADSLTILNVVPLPQFTLGTDTTLCMGQKLSYNFNLTGASYLWNNGSNLNSEIIAHAGEYWLKITAQGCAAVDTIHVFYKPSPVVNLGRDSSLCDSTTKQLVAFNNNATYLWQDGNATASYLVSKTGLYYVTVDINGCKAIDSVYIDYLSKPGITLVKDTFICKGQQIKLTPIAIAADSYLWQDGSRNISFEVKEPGTYVLTASNGCGITTSTVNVDLGTCELLMPTAFTPDNNRVNDLFRVKNIFAATEFHFTIYNRFGEIVYESNNIHEGWDGSYKGNAQNAGAYIWMISFISTNNIRKFAKGTVLLVR